MAQTGYYQVSLEGAVARVAARQRAFTRRPSEQIRSDGEREQLVRLGKRGEQAGGEDWAVLGRRHGPQGAARERVGEQLLERYRGGVGTDQKVERQLGDRVVRGERFASLGSEGCYARRCRVCAFRYNAGIRSDAELAKGLDARLQPPLDLQPFVTEKGAAKVARAEEIQVLLNLFDARRALGDHRAEVWRQVRYHHAGELWFGKVLESRRVGAGGKIGEVEGVVRIAQLIVVNALVRTPLKR